MTTNSFLLAFRRFLARRESCKVIYSDNAKTFLKSKKEIENLSRILSQSMVQNFIAKERIIWKNIIERSPWWGGFYERLVRSVKESLHKILGKALLSSEEMTTILTEIEAVLDLRPLSYVYEENDEPRSLTPMHFLNFGQNQPTYPVTFAEILENASTKSSLLKRKKYQ
ncbi:integrase catalytic domain-containing protein [Trichonephila inaurata madagascariensis]|uniref:Integrase catalytic domain-containing protein n=1 Tax=Trichonephila inaurata madagascariensis TaxID=2747483 RepID=A0A8X7C4K5_9ARAC|nr:integrase catalytic domain-containing protein [Trichonephila inaurata madagascariensis]